MCYSAMQYSQLRPLKPNSCQNHKSFPIEPVPTSNRLPEGVTAVTTAFAFSGTSTAETSQSCVSSGSDPQEQQQALSLRDGRLRTREESPTEGEADPTERSTEVEEVWPDRGPTTGEVPLMIIGNNFPFGRLYVRFGDSITCAVSEALRWLGG